MSVYIKDRYDLLIGGQWVPAENGDTFVTSNPATGEELAVCANASAADVDRAVRAAREAFPAGSAKSPAERAALLLKVADKIDERAKELAAVETQDNGKPIRETTLVDVPLSADHFRYFAVYKYFTVFAVLNNSGIALYTVNKSNKFSVIIS